MMAFLFAILETPIASVIVCGGQTFRYRGDRKPYRRKKHEFCLLSEHDAYAEKYDRNGQYEPQKKHAEFRHFLPSEAFQANPRRYKF
jgi:hypothetical protein